jgi:GntR family transcriptional regulator / MocR family aminotransferase
LGIITPVEHRFILVHLAEGRNSWRIEDDYDGEYYFQDQPILALQDINTSNRVVYADTFVKILFLTPRISDYGWCFKLCMKKSSRRSV